MKRILVIVLALISLFSMVGCNKEEDILHLGLNAEIIEINAADYSITVKDSGDGSENVFGGKAILDCSKAVQRDNILYANYDDINDVKTIEFEDLVVGDKVILIIYDSELKDNEDEIIAVDSIELATQRLD